MKTLVLNHLRERPLMVSIERIEHLVMMFFSGCLIGWVWEVLYVYLVSGELHNRGFFYGPWLPIYGFGCVLMMGIKHYAGDSKLQFAVTGIAVSAALEYSTSVVLETMFNARWWDYSMEAFNLNGRICLKGLLFFVLAGGLFVYVLEPRLRKLTNKLAPNLRRLICIGLVSGFAFDALLSFQLPNFGPAIFN